MSYVLTIRTRDAKLPRRFSGLVLAEHSGALRPTEFQIVTEDRDLAIAAYEHAKKNRKPGDEIELMNHETLGSV